MGRAKVPMELISDIKKRKLTFLGRKQGLIKKAQELSTLCDVDVSLIILSDLQETPSIFPTDPSKLNDMIRNYKNKRLSDSTKIKPHLSTNKKNKNDGDELANKAKRCNLEPKYPHSFNFLDNSERSKDFANGPTENNIDDQTKISLPELEEMLNSDYDDNTSIVSDDRVLELEKMLYSDYDDYTSGSSSITDVDNGYYPTLPMDQNIFGTDESLMTCEDVSDCYNGLKFDLQPEMMQQLEQPLNLDMQQFMIAYCY